jgi:hypothetical protein
MTAAPARRVNICVMVIPSVLLVVLLVVPVGRSSEPVSAGRRIWAANERCGISVQLISPK